MPPKNQRRSHTKSKLGCSQCKVRRIKCNEQRPTCSNCERRQIVCDFSVQESTPPDSIKNGEQAPKQQSSISDCSGLAGTPPPLLRTKTDPFQVPDLTTTKKTTDLDVHDLILMHHYNSVVSELLSDQHNLQSVTLWKSEIVALSFKYDFLLRGLLAISAIHLAATSPEKTGAYEVQASTHQSIALSSFQDTLAHVDESNCHAIFAFSCLTVLMAFASKKDLDSAVNFQQDILHWLYLLRGASIVLKMYPEHIRSSFLKPLLDEMHSTENAPIQDIANTDRITDLFSVCNRRPHDRDEMQAYNIAISSLLNTFAQASLLRDREQGIVLASLVWPINLPPKFLDMLTEEQPEALVIFAHYAILLYWAEDSSDNWFLGGWARYVLDAVQGIVGEEWKRDLVWPDSVVR